MKTWEKLALLGGGVTVGGLFLLSRVTGAGKTTLTIIAGEHGTTDPVPNVYQYMPTDFASITAIPDTGYYVNEWKVDGTSKGSQETLFLSMAKSHTVEISFTTTAPPPEPSIVQTIRNLTAAPPSTVNLNQAYRGWWTHYDSNLYRVTPMAEPDYTKDPWQEWWERGDINHDGYINDIDLALLQAAFGSWPGDSNWDPRCDLNGDGKVDIMDIFIAARNYGLNMYDGLLRTVILQFEALDPYNQPCANVPILLMSSDVPDYNGGIVLLDGEVHTATNPLLLYSSAEGIISVSVSYMLGDLKRFTEQHLRYGCHPIFPIPTYYACIYDSWNNRQGGCVMGEYVKVISNLPEQTCMEGQEVNQYDTSPIQNTIFAKWQTNQNVNSFCLLQCWSTIKHETMEAFIQPSPEPSEPPETPEPPFNI